MRYFLVSLSTFFSAALSVSNVCAGQNEIVNTGGDVAVAWSVEEGYRVNIKIKGKQGNEIFRKDLKVDVNNIKIEFWDVNQDGYDDVLVKYTHEAGFEFDVFVNINGDKFVDSLINLPLLHVDTEYVVDSDGNFLPRGTVCLKDVDSDSFPEIIVERVNVDRNRYKHIVLKYDAKDKMYVIAAKEPVI